MGTFNSTIGIIRSADLYKGTEDDIIRDTLKTVLKARKVKIGRKEMPIIELELAGDEVHSKIKIRQIYYTVRKINERLLQCYNCMEYGHSKNTAVKNKKFAKHVETFSVKETTHATKNLNAGSVVVDSQQTQKTTQYA